MIEQYSRWQDALDGKLLDLGARGDPPSGFYRFAPWKSDPDKKQTTIAIWRGEDGEIYVERNFAEPKTMTAMEADDLFTSQHVAISHELYESRRAKLSSHPWPEIHTTYLRTMDIQAGVPWTEEYARKRLSANVETHDSGGNPREKIGGNNPPPDATPVEVLTARIKALGNQLGAVLKGWGGKPTDKAQADVVGNFAVKFKALETEGVAAHKTEKAPYLVAGQAVDDKWREPRDLAVKMRTKALAIGNEWIDADKAARQAEADAANAAAREAAKKEAAVTGEAPAPIEEVKVEAAKIGTGRTVSQRVAEKWRVVRPGGYVVLTEHLVKNEAVPDYLAEAFDKLADLLGKTPGLGAKVPGIEKYEVRKAA